MINLTPSHACNAGEDEGGVDAVGPLPVMELPPSTSIEVVCKDTERPSTLSPKAIETSLLFLLPPPSPYGKWHLGLR
jgi:hypothetical protein